MIYNLVPIGDARAKELEPAIKGIVESLAGVGCISGQEAAFVFGNAFAMCLAQWDLDEKTFIDLVRQYTEHGLIAYRTTGRRGL